MKIIKSALILILMVFITACSKTGEMEKIQNKVSHDPIARIMFYSSMGSKMNSVEVNKNDYDHFISVIMNLEVKKIDPNDVKMITGANETIEIIFKDGTTINLMNSSNTYLYIDEVAYTFDVGTYQQFGKWSSMNED